MNGFNWLKKLLRNERGNVIAIGAATLPLLIGAGAVGMDTIQLALWKRQLQRTADSAALAGGRALVQKMVVADAVNRDLLLNNQVPLLGTATIEPPPTSGPFAGNLRAVRVILRSQQPLPFWSFFTGSAPTIETSATAMLVSSGQFCMMALENGSATAINMTGNSTLNLGCGIAANSTGTPAIDAKGSTEITASPIMAVGGLDPTNSKFGNATVIPHSDVQQDPFADRPDPSDIAPLNCSAPYDSSQTYADGGNYCFSSMDIDEADTLPSKSTIFIKNGNANFGTKARVTGEEVTIVFTGDGDNIGKFDMQGQAELSLTAPKEGSGTHYPGLVFVRDDDRATMDTLKINGGQELKLEGAMYFPNTRLWFNGNSNIAAKCLQIVARQLEFKGGADITNNCTDGYGKSLQATYVRLVG